MPQRRSPRSTTQQPIKVQPEVAPKNYDRMRDLPCLIPLWPHEVTDTTERGRLQLLAKLRRALRHERQRGIAGHWSYRLARHKALLDAYRHEVASMKSTKQGPTCAQEHRSKSGSRHA